MTPEIPYALYLKFKEPADAVVLSNVFDFIGLGFLGEDNIDGVFKVQHYHFKIDPSQKVLLHVETENDICERVNISIYSGASVESIKNLFHFFKDNFEENEVTLIDQQVKNELYIKHTAALSEEESVSIEAQARLTFSFDEFHKNITGNTSRNKLLHPFQEN